MIYRVGPFPVSPLVSLYDTSIATHATRTEVYRAEVANDSKRNDRALYDMANMGCANFILYVVEETWFKELKDPDTFYTKVKTIKLLDHLT